MNTHRALLGWILLPRRRVQVQVQEPCRRCRCRCRTPLYWLHLLSFLAPIQIFTHVFTSDSGGGSEIPAAAKVAYACVFVACCLLVLLNTEYSVERQFCCCW